MTVKRKTITIKVQCERCNSVEEIKKSVLEHNVGNYNCTDPYSTICDDCVHDGWIESEVRRAMEKDD